MATIFKKILPLIFQAIYYQNNSWFQNKTNQNLPVIPNKEPDLDELFESNNFPITKQNGQNTKFINYQNRPIRIIKVDLKQNPDFLQKIKDFQKLSSIEGLVKVEKFQIKGNSLYYQTQDPGILISDIKIEEKLIKLSLIKICQKFNPLIKVAQRMHEQGFAHTQINPLQIYTDKNCNEFLLDIYAEPLNKELSMAQRELSDFSSQNYNWIKNYKVNIREDLFSISMIFLNYFGKKYNIDIFRYDHENDLIQKQQQIDAMIDEDLGPNIFEKTKIKYQQIQNKIKRKIYKGETIQFQNLSNIIYEIKEEIRQDNNLKSQKKEYLIERLRIFKKSLQPSNGIKLEAKDLLPQISPSQFIEEFQNNIKTHSVNKKLDKFLLDQDIIPRSKEILIDEDETNGIGYFLKTNYNQHKINGKWLYWYKNQLGKKKPENNYEEQIDKDGTKTTLYKYRPSLGELKRHMENRKFQRQNSNRRKANKENFHVLNNLMDGFF